MKSLSLLIQSIIVTAEHEQLFIVVSKISLFFFLCHLTHKISLLVHMQKNKQQKKSFSVDELAHFFVNMLIIFIFISQIKKTSITISF